MSRSIQEIFFYRVENTKIFRLISWSIINPSNCKYQTIKLDCLYSIHPSIKEMVNLLSSIVLRTTWSKVLAVSLFLSSSLFDIAILYLRSVEVSPILAIAIFLYCLKTSKTFGYLIPGGIQIEHWLKMG